jgi:hypothetical protein
MPVVRGIVRSAAGQNYAMQAILLGIVKSDPFQMRTKLTDTTVKPSSTAAAVGPAEARSAKADKE